MIKFKKDTQTKLKISKERYNSGDVIGALSVLFSDKPYGKGELDLYYEQAKIYLKEQNYNAAIEILLLYVQLGNKRERCNGLNALGYAFLQLNNYVLADAFFNLQLDVSLKQVCDYDDEMYEYFSKEDKKKNTQSKFKAVKLYEEEFKEGFLNFELEEYNKSLEYYNKIPSTSNFYLESIYYKSKIYFILKQDEKGLAYLREYFNLNKKPSVFTYYEFINILAEKEMQEYKYYLQELLNINKYEGKDNLLVADLVFKFTDNYTQVISLLDEYEKTVKISTITLSLRGIAHLYNNDLENAKKYVKQAYLYSNLSKYRHILKDTSKKSFILYPKNIANKFKEFLNKELLKEKIDKVSYTTLKDLFEIAIDLEDKQFWHLYLDYLEKLNKKVIEFYLKQLLIVPDVDLYVKVRAKRILANRGFIGELIEFGRIPTRAPFIKLDNFKTEYFKRGYVGAYTALFILTDKRYIKKAEKLEDIIINTNLTMSDNDLSAVIMCYLLNDGLKAKSYRDLFGVNKGRIIELYKQLKLNIKRKK